MNKEQCTWKVIDHSAYWEIRTSCGSKWKTANFGIPYPTPPTCMYCGGRIHREDEKKVSQ